MTWPTVKLGDVCEISRGGSPRPIQNFITEDVDGLNWIKIGDVSEGEKYITKTAEKIKPSGLSHTRQIKSGDFLLSNSMSFGRPYISKIDGCIHDGWLMLRDINNNFSQDYLYHMLTSQTVKDQFIKYATGAVVKNLNKEVVSKVLVPLPPLAEQKRIAAILDKAEEIKRKREQAIAKLDELALSTFVEMFGGIIKTRELGEICDVRDGTHDSPKYTNSGYPLITSKNLTGGAINFQEVNLISEEDYLAICKRSKVDCGDILMPMIGTIGNPVIVQDKNPKFAIKNVALIKFHKGSPNTKYINALLKSEVFKKYVSKTSRGGTQKFLSLGDIRKFPVPISSKVLELEFEKKIDLKEKLLLSQYASMSHTEQLLSALQHQAFTTGFNA